MIIIEIPGRETLKIDHVVLDYNGTVAEDGILLSGLLHRFEKLKESAEVRILTADTYGTVRKQCEPLGIQVETFPGAFAAECKEKIVKGLSGGVCCIGNGYNDTRMFAPAALRIAVLGKEGIYPGLLTHSDVLTTSPEDALDLLLKPDRLRATLRT